MSKDYSVRIDYVLKGHVYALVEDVASEEEAIQQATSLFKDGEYDEDIGINMGNSIPQIISTLAEEESA